VAYSEIVAERLSAEQVLLRSVRDLSDSLTVATQELNLQPIDAFNELGDWEEARIRRIEGCNVWVKLLETEVAADADLLNHLRRLPAAVANDSIAGNLSAFTGSIESQRALAESLSAVVRLMNGQSEAALGLLKSANSVMSLIARAARKHQRPQGRVSRDLRTLCNAMCSPGRIMARCGYLAIESHSHTPHLISRYYLNVYTS
jgi:hypothetical protein